MYGASIGLGTRFASNPILPHGLHGIFISNRARVGNRVTIFQQVTIGSIKTESSKSPGAPVIGNNVLIGAGARIIGGITIGDNVKIGANCVVVDDVEDNCTLVLEKPRVIRSRHEEDSKKLTGS